MAGPKRPLKRRHEVHPIEGNIVTMRKVWDISERRFVDREVEEPGGYDVFFPNRHSIRVRNEAELKRLHLVDNAPLIDMSTGEVVEEEDREMSFKDATEASARRGRANKRTAA